MTSTTREHPVVTGVGLLAAVAYIKATDDEDGRYDLVTEAEADELIDWIVRHNRGVWDVYAIVRVEDNCDGCRKHRPGNLHDPCCATEALRRANREKEAQGS